MLSLKKFPSLCTCCRTKRWRGACSCPVESVSVLKAAVSSSWLDHTVRIWSHQEGRKKRTTLHRHLLFYFHSYRPLQTSSSSEKKKKKQSGWEQFSCKSASRGRASSSLGSHHREPRWRDGRLISSLPRRRLAAVFGNWMTCLSSLSSVLHVGPEWARLESLVQPVVLAGRPSQGSRRVELRVGEAERPSLVGSRQRPAAAHGAPVLRARLGLQLGLAQIQQRRYLLPHRQGFEPASRQVKKGFDERL